VSELAGKSNILWKAARVRHRHRPGHTRLATHPEELKALEDQGFQFEGAEASFELLIERALGRHRPYFDLDAYRVIVEEQRGDAVPCGGHRTRASEGMLEHTAAAGNGPVNALDHALRKALEEFYPDCARCACSTTRSAFSTSPRHRWRAQGVDHVGRWRRDVGHGGVAENIIEASWHALVDSIEYSFVATNADAVRRVAPLPRASRPCRRPESVARGALRSATSAYGSVGRRA
jgi:2-isopropylmalate synthase